MFLLGWKAGVIFAGSLPIPYLQWVLAIVGSAVGTWCMVSGRRALERLAKTTIPMLLLPKLSPKVSLLIIHSAGDQAAAALKAVQLLSGFAMRTLHHVSTWAGFLESDRRLGWWWFVKWTFVMLAAGFIPYWWFVDWALGQRVSPRIIFLLYVVPGVGWAIVAGMVLILSSVLLVLLQSAVFGV